MNRNQNHNKLFLSSLLWRPAQLYLRERGRGEKINEALLVFQSTADIHFQNVYETLFQSTVEVLLTYTFKTHTKHTQNCEGSHSVHLLVTFQTNEASFCIDCAVYM